MITVSFTADSDHALTARFSGHAGSAPYGHDLVCAACSVLALTLAQCIRDMVGSLSLPPFLSLAEGETVVKCVPQTNAFDRVLAAFETVQTGVALLEANYPNYVRLTDRL